MKLAVLFFTLLFGINTSFGQTTIVDTIEVDGIERYFRLHLPPNYSPEANLPLVMNFHGYGSNAIQQELYSGLFLLANTENFVVCHPEGTFNSNGIQFFNAGFTPNETVDDVNFASTLIDHLLETYQLDETRVYSCGMSNGGYISYKLACEIGEKLAAICSVTGSMVIPEQEACNPLPIPVMQMHGTEDPTVLYNGNQFTLGIEELVDYWVNVNQCDITPEITAIEDVDPSDGCTAELYKYSNGIYGNEVHFYKILGGEHTWVNGSITIGVTNRDFDANLAMWEFFKQYTNEIPEPPTNNSSVQNTSINVFPNPFTNELNVNLSDNFNLVKIYSIDGKLIKSATNNTISTTELTKGVYILEIEANGKHYFEKVVKE